MIYLKKMIMIGATARQSGKTELACHIINKFRMKEKITGIKVTTLHEDDAAFHKSLNLPWNENFIIEKSTVQRKNKSTDRMLAAGATETFWVHSKIEFLNEALQQLLPMIDKKSFSVCESNSLRIIAKPDVFIMIKNSSCEIKNSVSGILELADFSVNFNGNEFNGFDLHKLNIEKGKWIYKNNH
ncbi:MAG: hypothetical protein V1904_05460 [Bacteroidota bacterium]